MVRRKKWNRRRGDNRVETKNEYALIQDTADANRADFKDDCLAIPDFQPQSSNSHPELSEEIPPPEAPAAQSASRVFALVGATGGVGTTSIASQLAHEFAFEAASKLSSTRRPTDAKVCLIDLDFESGACAHHLDLLPSLSLEDLCGPAEQIDKAFTQALVSTHECGVSLLAAPNTVDANARVNPQTVMAMLDAAADLFETVIIDLPRYEQSWTRSVMRAVDVLGITCELTIPSLHAARERLARLSSLGTRSINAEIILSKFERRSFKNTLRLGDAETALGRSVYTTICLDPDTTREALNCGEPAGSIRPESRFVKDVRKLSDNLKRGQINPLAKVA